MGMSPDVKEGWNKHLKRYPGLQGVGLTELGKYYNHWVYGVRRIVAKYFLCSLPVNRDQAKVLDIGSGIGFYVKLWKDLGVKHLLGMDIAAYAVTLLKKKYPMYTFKEGDIGDPEQVHAALGDTKVNIVTAFDVLFHILDEDKYRNAFQNIANLIQPGGYFVFSENFVHNRAIKGVSEVFRPKGYIEQLLVENHFSISYRGPMLVLSNAPVDTRNSYWSRWWKIWSRMIRKGEAMGYLCGLVIFPIELVCVALLKESPTTEIMIARKK